MHSKLTNPVRMSPGPKPEAQRRPVSLAGYETNRFTLKEIKMAWTKPEFTDLRFGFEVTMYIANR